jgi:heptose-I-phosphate ethanolaminephosphotransferase
VVWRNAQPLPQAAALQPFRADWTGWTLMDLLNIRWSGQQSERDVLANSYRWQVPEIPVKVESFSR